MYILAFDTTRIEFLCGLKYFIAIKISRLGKHLRHDRPQDKYNRCIRSCQF